MGYAAGADAYRAAVETLSADTLSTHYTEGQEHLRGAFRTQLVQRISEMTSWDLSDHAIFAAGSDVDLMTHVVDTVAAEHPVVLHPGDWYGFVVGSRHQDNVRWGGRGALACLCVPSVRNGHITDEMVRFLGESEACLLNLNLFPTLRREEQRAIGDALAPLLGRSILSISFSRGWGLTASQLGVALVPKTHPIYQAYQTQWDWLSYFYNRLAADAFLAFDHERASAVDAERRAWVLDSLERRGLPIVETGTYYVKSFQIEGEPAAYLKPLLRESAEETLARLCFKTPIS